MSPTEPPRSIDPNSGEPATDQDRNDLQPPVALSDDERQALDPEAEREARSEREDGTNLGS